MILGNNFFGSGTAFPTGMGQGNAGDLFFRTDLGALFYYNGTNWISVTSTATIAFHATRTTNQTVGTAATKVLWNAEEYDYGADFDADGVDSNFTAPIAGLYHFAAVCNVACVDTEIIDVALYKNGAWTTRLASQNGSRTGSLSVGGSTEIELIANDLIDIRVATAVGSRTLNGGGSIAYFFGRLIRAKL